MISSRFDLAGKGNVNPFKHLDWFGSFLLPVILKLSGSPFIFGYAKPVPVNFLKFRNYRKGTLLVATAGVAANMVLAVLSGFCFQFLLKNGSIWFNSAIRPVAVNLFLMLGYSAIINSILVIFNLIPIPPLDGSRVVALLLPPAVQNCILSSYVWKGGRTSSQSQG